MLKEPICYVLHDSSSFTGLGQSKAVTETAELTLICDWEYT